MSDRKREPRSGAWPPAWEAVRPYLDFVRTLAQQHRALQGQLGADDLEDLFQEFIVDRLPKVVERLELLPEADRERYLVVVFKNFVRTHLRSASRYKRAMDAFALQPQAEPIRQSPLAEATLPPELSSIMSSHFSEGLSLRVVAEKFGITRYAARKALVDGSLALLVQRDHEERLSKREVAVVRHILLLGSSVAETSEELGLTEAQVRSALASARAWVVQKLEEQT